MANRLKMPRLAELWARFWPVDGAALEPPAPDRHAALRRADPFAFAITHRRLAWLLRLSVATNIVMVVAFGIAMSGYSALLPLKEVRVALLRTAADEDRVFRVEPMEQNVRGFDILMESSARRFVKLLLEIDDATQKARFDEAFLLMDPEFRRRWLGIHEDRIRKALGDGLEREIAVETTHRLDQRVGEWLVTVDFRQTDRIGGGVVGEAPLRAYIRLTTRPARVSRAELYMNPLGITVLDMTVKARGASAGGASAGSTGRTTR